MKIKVEHQKAPDVVVKCEHEETKIVDTNVICKSCGEVF
jgi:hypothetical protein